MGFRWLSVGCSLEFFGCSMYGGGALDFRWVVDFLCSVVRFGVGCALVFRWMFDGGRLLVGIASAVL